MLDVEVSGQGDGLHRRTYSEGFLHLGPGEQRQPGPLVEGIGSDRDLLRALVAPHGLG